MRKKIFESKILSNKEITAGIYRIILQIDSATTDMVVAADMVAAAAAPGQFINLYLQDKSMLLPRPISICLAEKDQITLVYRVVGKGTKELSAYREGDLLRISTPLGHGYDIDSIFKALDEGRSEAKTIALVAGGLGVPPMLELAKTIHKRLRNNRWSDADGNRNTTIKLIAMIGFQAEPFLSEELRSFCNEVHIATESGAAGFHGNVMEMMESEGINADYYLSCGPRPMLKALAEYCGKINKPLQVSLEERMGCGYGACVGCTCKTLELSAGIMKVQQKKVCKDGPVFFGNEVIWNE